MEFNQRVRFDPAVTRPPLRGPDGCRVIVWPIVVLEVWDIEHPMPRQVVPPPAARPVPDYLNWSWHEYEMRVAFWRLKRLFDAHHIAPSVSINSAVCSTYPDVAAACRDARWEFIAHGVKQRPVSDITDEPAMISQCLDEIEAFTGLRPRGWASPGIAQTRESVDHLKAAGLEYACDWVLDDQPFEIETCHGPLVGLPYTVELNDVPTIVIAKQPIQSYAQAIRDAFDYFYAEGDGSLHILTLVLHPYVCATPSRISHIEQVLNYMHRPGVEFWTGDKILDWFNSAKRSPVAIASR